MTTDLPSSLRFSPYFAGLEQKTETEASALEDRIDRLPESVRAILFDELLPESLEGAARVAKLPEQYFIALSKIVFLIILGDVPISATGQLLGKLGLSSDTASTLAASLDKILKPLITARAQQSVAQGMKPLGPLTQRIGAPTAPPPPIPNTPARNIIDLRNKPQT